MVSTRTAFHEHPYKPYPIQQQFMEDLYRTLDDGAIGLFESPTGTGKTISIICGALHWLEDFRQRAKDIDAAASAAGADDDDPGWLREHRTTVTGIVPEPHQWLKRRGMAAAQGSRVVRPLTLGESTAAGRPGGLEETALLPYRSTGGKAGDEDEQFLLAPTSTDLSDGRGGGADQGDSGSAAVGARRARLQALLGGGGSSDEEGGCGEPDDLRSALRALRAPPAHPTRKPQVFFASRTHSQLAQFVSELCRTGFSSRLRLVSLASRKGLCVHEPVAALGSAGLITERCTELQERSKGGCKARRTAGHGDGGGAGCGGAGEPKARGGGETSCSSRQSVGPGPSSRGRGGGRARASGGGCPFLSPTLEACEDFAGAVLSEPMDVEDLGRTGRRLGLCPYYGSRALLSEADIVALPYSALLCEETRGSLGIRLEGSVVIFDEAHNLVDAVTSSHGSQVSLEQLRTTVRQLSAYFSRFQTRLSPASARNVQLLMRLATSLQRCLERQPPPPTDQQQQQQRPVGAADIGDGSGAAEVLTCHDFLLSNRMEHLNLFPLLSWVRESRLVMKVAGYDLATSPQGPAGGAATAAVDAAVDLYDDESGSTRLDGGGQRRGSAADAAASTSGSGGATSGFGARRSALFAFISFLAALTHPNSDGRIVAARASRAAPGGGGGVGGGGADLSACLRYTVLNAAAQFAAIVRSARSVVLASGTLSPVEGLVAQLLPGEPPHRLRHFSCGHVVPSENLLALVAARGPTGLELDLRHGRRADPRVCEEIGRLLTNVCTAVPAGVVVFAPSFAYLDQLVSAWRRSDAWTRLCSRKHVFVEPRSAGEVEAVLTAYAAATRRGASGPSAGGAAAGPLAGPSGGSSGRRPNGALLLSVVGGKLSEGINFGDDLGRCVVVLGLPYPNPSDPELRERMRYLDEAATSTSPTVVTFDAKRTTALPASEAAGPGDMPALPPPAPPRLTGRQYYEGLCIKAVNQCVGRVIRHANDYAAIVLVDVRYLPYGGTSITKRAGGGGSGGVVGRGDGGGVKPGGGVVGSLPSWIQQSLRPGNGDFAHLYGNLVGFFRGRAAASRAAGPAAASAGAVPGEGHGRMSS